MSRTLIDDKDLAALRAEAGYANRFADEADQLRSDRDREAKRAAAMANVLQPFITAHETGELAGMLEHLARRADVTSWHALRLLRNMKKSAITHGLIEEGGSDAE